MDMNISKMKPMLASSNVTPLFRDKNRFNGIDIATLNEAEQERLIELSLELLAFRHRKGAELEAPNATKDYLRMLLAEASNEHFGVVFLDTKHRVIRNEVLFNGTICNASVHPRVIVQKALDCNASAVFIYHNHPSGVAEPSHADQQITNRIKDALALIDVRMLDHFIVGTESVVSFAERGLI